MATSSIIENIDNINRSILGSQVKQKKTSSVVTIFASINSMVGSVILLIPINWKDSGVLFSTIAMFTLGFISYKTCSWIVIVSKGQPDLSYLVRKYLKDRDYKIFVLASSILLFGVGQIYFILLNSTLYQILTQIFAFSNFSNFAAKNDFTFKQFSMQWQAICIMAVVFPLYFVKKMDFIVKIGRVGAISIYAYLVLILYLFIENAANDRINHDSVKTLDLFTPNVANILGNFAMAFAVHNAITELMSNNKDPEKNPRNCKILFACVCLIYAIIGIMGTFAIIGRPTSVANPEDIFDFFKDQPKNIPIFIVALVFFTHLITVQPFFCFISKSQLKTILFPPDEEPIWYKFAYNAVFMLTSLSIVIFQANPNYVIGFIGSVFGFVVVYYVPIQLRLNQQKILVGENLAKQEQKEKVKQMNDIEEKLLVQQQTEISHQGSESDIQPQLAQQNEIKQKHPTQLWVFIVFLLVFGFGLMVLQLLQTFGAIKS